MKQVAVATTAPVPREAENPAVSVTPAEQVESAHAAFESESAQMHSHGARRLIETGLMVERRHVQVVMGVKHALAAQAQPHDLMLGEPRRVLPQARQTAIGNARLVGLGCESVTRHGCRPATPAAVRQILRPEMAA